MTEQTPEERLTAAELVEIWQALSAGEQIEGFQALDPADAEDFFLSCGTLDQATLVLGLPVRERRLWLPRNVGASSSRSSTSLPAARSRLCSPMPRTRLGAS
jgi:hypothetical protein